jgi:predicted Zn-dependent peptidase
MVRLGRSEFSFGRNVPPEEIEAGVDAVTKEQIDALAGELLAPERLGLCVLGPLEDIAITWRPDAAVA